VLHNLQNSLFMLSTQLIYFTAELHLSERWLSGSAWPFGKFVENSAKLTCLEIICYRIKYSTVL